MKKKVIITIAIILIAALAYWGWRKRYDYFFQGNEIETNQDASGQPGQENQPAQSDAQGQEEGVMEEYKPNTQPEISDYDCSLECSNRKETGSYAYCLEICGLNGSEGQTDADSSEPEDCDSKTGLQKDSCYKAKAIKEKDYVICEKIEDNQLKENCKNRVTEEIF